MGTETNSCTVITSSLSEWKISPLNGDGNTAKPQQQNSNKEWKISPLNGDGNRLLYFCECQTTRMEDKSPEWGRKRVENSSSLISEILRMEDKSPEWGRKPSL